MKVQFAIAVFFNNIDDQYNLCFSDEDTRDNAYTLIEEYMYKGGIWSNPECTLRTDQIRLMTKNRIYT